MKTVLARFDSAQALITAARAAREAGFTGLEAYAPMPVPGLAEAVGFHERSIAPLALLGGLTAAALAYVLQWYAGVIDYPWVVGGKPPHSWPAFLLVTFAVGILAAVLTAVVAMLAGNGLPRPHHPAFDWSEFDRASGDGFFLMVQGGNGENIEQFLSDNQAVASLKIEPP